MARSKNPPAAKTGLAQAAKAAVAATPAVVAPAVPAEGAAKKVKAAPAPAPIKAKAKVAADVAKPAKAKLVRDSFTIPKDEYQALDTLKARALGLGQHVKKSELLRAGIQALSAMPDKAFQKAVQAVPTLKTGRPKSDA
jgi:hypothetical protein